MIKTQRLSRPERAGLVRNALPTSQRALLRALNHGTRYKLRNIAFGQVPRITLQNYLPLEDKSEREEQLPNSCWHGLDISGWVSWTWNGTWNQIDGGCGGSYPSTKELQIGPTRVKREQEICRILRRRQWSSSFRVIILT